MEQPGTLGIMRAMQGPFQTCHIGKIRILGNVLEAGQELGKVSTETVEIAIV
jgi:hypothetical protein